MKLQHGAVDRNKRPPPAAGALLGAADRCRGTAQMCFVVVCRRLIHRLITNKLIFTSCPIVLLYKRVCESALTETWIKYETHHLRIYETPVKSVLLSTDDRVCVWLNFVTVLIGLNCDSMKNINRHFSWLKYVARMVRYVSNDVSVLCPKMKLCRYWKLQALTFAFQGRGLKCSHKMIYIQVCQTNVRC